MFVYCNNNPTYYSDSEGTSAVAAAAWASSMWWLPLLDGPLPVGEILFGVGLIITMVIIVETSDTTSSLVSNRFWGEEETLPVAQVKSSHKPKTGRPGLKKQGREGLEKKKGNGWTKRSGKRERTQPRPHHPSKRGHRKNFKN